MTTTFRFIHTADWQIGAPFGSYESELSARLREARVSAIERIGNLAQDKSVQHIIVAGDVWDSEQPSDSMIRQPLDIMGETADATWWLLPGNHDPHRRNMLWDRIGSRAPDNVRLMLEPEPVEAERGVWFLPAPWTAKMPGRDLTEWMDEASTPEGALRIGVGHGSIHDFYEFDESEARSTHVISPDRARNANLDYLALGDWHGVVEINPRVWYSGTPEPDRFRRNKPGHVLLVELQKDAQPNVEICPTAEYNWQICDIQCLPRVEAYPELDALESQGSLRQTLFQIYLRGQLLHDEWTMLSQRLMKLAERCAFLDELDSGLSILVSQDDLNALDQGGSVRMAAESLLERKEDQSLPQSERDIAHDALMSLLTFAAEEAVL